MIVKNAIVHLLEKEQHKPISHVHLRETELSRNGEVADLVSRLSELYGNRSSKAYGKFDKQARLGRKLDAFEKDSLSFVQLSHIAMEELKNRIALVSAATGGYMFFARYQLPMGNYFLAVMLKKTGGISFDEHLEVLEVHHLDLSSLHLAARVNISEWQTFSARNYISFVKGKANTGFREYFTSFLGITEFTESASATRSLVSAISNYCRERRMSDEETARIKLRALEYGEDQLRGHVPLQLEELSMIVDPRHPHDFSEYANNLESPLIGEFYLDHSALRRLVRYAGREADISISFSNEIFGNDKRVRYLPDKNALVISPPPAGLLDSIRGADEE